MKWFKFETQEEEMVEEEYMEQDLHMEHQPKESSMLVYLSPDALKHAVIVDDFDSFQSSNECIPGGRLLEVNRQFSYRLRQVADLVEEPMEIKKPTAKAQPKREFHSEIRPEKRPTKQAEESLFEETPMSFTDRMDMEDKPMSTSKEESHKQIRPEQVPFEDLESLFVK